MALFVLASLALLAISAVLGAAVWRIAGLPASSHVAPLVGFCGLLVLVQPVMSLPGRGWTAAALVVVLVLAAAASRGVREDVRAGLREGLPVSLAALALLCIPFLVSGRFGILGFGNNDDFVMHLTVVRWIAWREIPEVDTVAEMSYPMGPHAVAGTLLTLGVPGVAALTAVMAMGPILACRAMLAALPPVGRALRAVLALLAGLGYLGAAYYVQASHKEAMAMAPILGFALAMPAVVSVVGTGDARAAARAALAPTLLVAGVVQIISGPGALWPLATLAVWAVIWLLRRGAERGSLRAALEPRALRAAAVAVGAGVLIALVVLAPELHRIVAFQSTSFANEREGGVGNLEGPLPPWHALGIWLNPDFRFDTALPLLTALLIAGAFALIVVALVRWVRRGPEVFAAALLANWVGWLFLELFKNPYNAAKGLAIMAPMMGLALVTGAVVAWSHRRKLRTRGAGHVVARTGALAVLAGAAVSTGLALRDGVVGPGSNAEQLATLSASHTGPTALLDPSDFGAWYLYRMRPYRPPLLYLENVLPLRPEKSWRAGEPADVDTIAPDAINRFEWIVAPNTSFASAMPPQLRVARRTRDWTLWQRVGTVPARETLEEDWRPGAELDCSTPKGRALSRRHGTAVVRTVPVVGSWLGWDGTAVDAGSTASRELRLPAGRWDLSLQYVSRNALTVTAPGLRARMPATLDRMASFFSLGTVTSDGSPLRVQVHVDRMNWFARLVRAKGSTRALNAHGFHPLGAIAATPHGERPRHVPLARACGRYVDSYTLG